jgi:hypothetical protein
MREDGMTKLTEQQKQIANEAYSKHSGFGPLYAAVEAVLEQQAWPTDEECRADAPGGPLAQRTPATAPAPQSTEDVDPNVDSSPAVLKAQIRFWKKLTEVRTAALAEARRGEIGSLHLECPFTGFKFSFHTQEQVDMLQNHFEALAERGYFSAAEIEKAIRAEWARAEMAQVYFIAAVLARLSAKEQPVL